MNSQTRESRRDRIVAFFCAHVGERFPTDYLHGQFGPAFRSRVSEMNRDPECSIRVFNYTARRADGTELSCYWAEWNSPQGALFPGFLCDQATERHRDDG
jgi:hypothetical protein